MDVLKVDGKDYVKASVIARELGYTADYVGQLCRSGKVDAKLFGRSWYVDRDSIRGHKSTRYRSTQAQSVKAIRVHSDQEKEEDKTPKVHGNSLFYRHNRLKPTPKYDVDDSELIPAIGEVAKKKGKLSVGLADASSVRITSASEKYEFNTPERPAIKFSGSLSISEFSVNDSFVKEGGVVLHPKQVEKLHSDKKAKTIASSAKPVIKNGEDKKVNNDEEKKIVPIEIDELVTEVAISTSGEPLPSASIRYVQLVAVTVLSLCLAVVLHSLEAHVFATSDTISTKYVFEIDHLLASVYSSSPEAFFVIEN